jgi:hypothetical protein
VDDDAWERHADWWQESFMRSTQRLGT